MTANELDYVLADLLRMELEKRDLGTKLFGNGSACYDCCVVEMLRPVLSLLEVGDKYFATEDHTSRWHREWAEISRESEDAERSAWAFLKYLRREARAVKQAYLESLEQDDLSYAYKLAEV